MTKIKLIQSLRADQEHASDQSLQAAYDWGYQLGKDGVDISSWAYNMLRSETKAMNEGWTKGKLASMRAKQ